MPTWVERSWAGNAVILGLCEVEFAVPEELSEAERIALRRTLFGASSWRVVRRRLECPLGSGQPACARGAHRARAYARRLRAQGDPMGTLLAILRYYRIFGRIFPDRFGRCATAPTVDMAGIADRSPYKNRSAERLDLFYLRFWTREIVNPQWKSRTRGKQA